MIKQTIQIQTCWILNLLNRHFIQVWTTFLRPSRDLFKRYKGGYVVVTGATNGLGYEYARQFAQKGFGLILISRDQDKLERVKKEIQEINSKIDIITIAFDFNIPYTEEGYKKLKDKLLELKDVSVLVNNVGALYNAPYAEMKMCDINTMIQVNCIPQSFMTNTLLPSMLKRSKDEGKRCAIMYLISKLYSII